MIEIDTDDEGPAEAVIVVDDAGTKKDNRHVDVTFVVDGDVLLVSFHILANPRAKARAVRKFVSGWSDATKYLVNDKDTKGMYCRACREVKMDSAWGLKLCSAESGR